MTPLLCVRITPPKLLAIVIAATLLTLSSPFAEQTKTNPTPRHDPLQAFVGIWTARNANESIPYLFLKFEESNGKLSGTISHFSFHAPGGPAFQPLIGASGTAGETPITDINVANGALDFVWAGDGSLQGGRITFTLEGTEAGFLTLPISREEGRTMLNERNSGGFDPRVSIRRETENRTEEKTVSPSWPPEAVARLIVMAETQYKFAHGAYADYSTLLGSGQLRQSSEHFTFRFEWLQPGPKPLSGYWLRFVTAQDGSAYQFSLLENTVTGCGTNLFSNETGIIFQGHSDDCPAK